MFYYGLLHRNQTVPVCVLSGKAHVNTDIWRSRRYFFTQNIFKWIVKTPSPFPSPSSLLFPSLSCLFFFPLSSFGGLGAGRASPFLQQLNNHNGFKASVNMGHGACLISVSEDDVLSIALLVRD